MATVVDRGPPHGREPNLDQERASLNGMLGMSPKAKIARREIFRVFIISDGV